MTKTYSLVGMKYRGRDIEIYVSLLPAGEPLLLVREPFNKFDEFAVQVWNYGKLLGYIKGDQVRPLADAMDADALAHRSERESTENNWKAKLAWSPDRWPLVEVEPPAEDIG